MIRTTPFRLTTLHLSQIFFTEDLTFILRSFSLIMLLEPSLAKSSSNGGSSKVLSISPGRPQSQQSYAQNEQTYHHQESQRSNHLPEP